jgi:hypothetical protein
VREITLEFSLFQLMRRIHFGVVSIPKQSE